MCTGVRLQMAKSQMGIHKTRREKIEIRFCYSKSQREYANEVVKNFVEEIIKEEERLKG